MPTRLMAGLAILKHTHNLSDEVLCELWIENPYCQYFCGEEFFQRRLPLDRSSMTNWRQRMGEERLQGPLQESLAVATKTGAMNPGDLARVIVDTTVQPKNVIFPTDAKLLNRAREKMVKLAKKCGVELRQPYTRVGKFELIQHQRYAHAKQFKRAHRALRKLKTNLGRVIRDFARKIDSDPGLEAAFAHCWAWRGASAPRSKDSAGPRSTACMRPKWSASARARRTSLTSSASRSAWPPPSSTARAASSSSTHKRCPAIPMTGIRWPRHSGDRATRRQYDRTAACRCRIPRPQCAARLQVQNLHLKADIIRWKGSTGEIRN